MNPSARVEELEVRRLFVAGTVGNDYIRVTPRSAGDVLGWAVEVNGTRVAEGLFVPFLFPNVGEHFQPIPIDCLGGDDVVDTDPLLGGPVSVAGGDGADTIVGSHHGDTLLGNGSNDLIFGKNARDLIVGGAGHDTLRGGNHPDTLYGDAGGPDGTIKVGRDLLLGDAGDDGLYGGKGNDVLHGGANTDHLAGNDGDDQLFGGDGDDFLALYLDYPPNRATFDLYAGSGNDVFDGGAGLDGLGVESATVPIFVSPDGVANDGFAGHASNVLPNIEVMSGEFLAPGSVIDCSAMPQRVETYFHVSSATPVTGPTVAPITLIGTPFDDILHANFEGHELIPQHIDGGAGNDEIRSGLSDNVLTGGDGNDTIYGFGGDDRIGGGPGNDSILASYGDDIVGGDDGNDTIEGSAGKDRISGGPGDDLVYGDEFESNEFEEFAFYGSDILEGNAGNDVVIGGGHNDRIWGHGGRDTLLGNGGNDTIFGGPEDADTVRGGPGNDSAAQDEKDLYESVEVMLV